MAVVKIVPMPGVAVVGPTGAQGPIGLTGPAGADGQDGSQLNYWDGSGAPQDPAEDGFLIVDGIVTGLGSNLLVSAADRVFIGGNNGEFLNGSSSPENQIATIGDLTTPVSGTWNLIFNDANGSMVESEPSNLTYAEYYTIGELVYFDMQYSFENVSNYGVGAYVFNLPFTPRNPNNFSNNTILTGKIQDQSIPDRGSNVIFGSVQTVHPYTLQDGGWVLLEHQDTSNEMELLPVSYSLPASLSGVQINPYSLVRMSGVYRKA